MSVTETARAGVFCHVQYEGSFLCKTRCWARFIGKSGKLIKIHLEPCALDNHVHFEIFSPRVLLQSSATGN